MAADVFYLSLRDVAVGGGVRLQSEVLARGPGFSTTTVARDALFTKQRLVFLVHGFANSRQDAVVRWTRFADAVVDHEPALQAATFVVLLWPGDSARLGAFCYPFIENDADRSAIELAWFFAQDGTSTQASRFVSPTARKDVVAMSYGAHVACAALAQLATNNGKTTNGGVCCLLAAATDASCLANPHAFRDAARAVDAVHVAFSSDDTALARNRPIGDLLSAVVGAADRRALLRQRVEHALGLVGPRDFLSHAWDRAKVFPVQWVGFDHVDYEPPTSPAVAMNAKQEIAARKVAQWLVGAR